MSIEHLCMECGQLHLHKGKTKFGDVVFFCPKIGWFWIQSNGSIHCCNRIDLITVFGFKKEGGE